MSQLPLTTAMALPHEAHVRGRWVDPLRGTFFERDPQGTWHSYPMHSNNNVNPTSNNSGSNIATLTVNPNLAIQNNNVVHPVQPAMIPPLPLNSHLTHAATNNLPVPQNRAEIHASEDEMPPATFNALNTSRQIKAHGKAPTQKPATKDRVSKWAEAQSTQPAGKPPKSAKGAKARTPRDSTIQATEKRKRGRQPGAAGWLDLETERLLLLVRKYLPIGGQGWKFIEKRFNKMASEESTPIRPDGSLEQRFKRWYTTPKPTGTGEIPDHITQSLEIYDLIEARAGIATLHDNGENPSPVVVFSDMSDSEAGDGTEEIIQISSSSDEERAHQAKKAKRYVAQSRPTQEFPKITQGGKSTAGAAGMTSMMSQMAKTFDPEMLAAKEDVRVMRQFQATELSNLRLELRDLTQENRELRSKLEKAQEKLVHARSHAANIQTKLEVMQMMRQMTGIPSSPDVQSDTAPTTLLSSANRTTLRHLLPEDPVNVRHVRTKYRSTSRPSSHLHTLSSLSSGTSITGATSSSPSPHNSPKLPAGLNASPRSSAISSIDAGGAAEGLQYDELEDDERALTQSWDVTQKAAELAQQ